MVEKTRIAGSRMVQPIPCPKRFLTMNSRTLKIVSGGQTGVDRAALDAAIQSGLPHGGWVPLGRTAESERIPSIYVLQETPTTELCLRTEWNIRDSDATLI